MKPDGHGWISSLIAFAFRALQSKERLSRMFHQLSSHD